MVQTIMLDGTRKRDIKSKIQGNFEESIIKNELLMKTIKYIMDELKDNIPFINNIDDILSYIEFDNSLINNIKNKTYILEK